MKIRLKYIKRMVTHLEERYRLAHPDIIWCL